MKKKYDIKTTDVETLKKWYHLMTLGRALDEKAPSYLLQSLGWSYHAPYAGMMVFSLPSVRYSLWRRLSVSLLPRYADCTFCRNDSGRNHPEWYLESDRPGSGGRHMSNHFAKPEWHIENISSATVHTTFMRQVWHGNGILWT